MELPKRASKTQKLRFGAGSCKQEASRKPRGSGIGPGRPVTRRAGARCRPQCQVGREEGQPPKRGMPRPAGCPIQLHHVLQCMVRGGRKEQSVSTVRGGKAEEEPRALQIRQLGKLAKQRVFGCFKPCGAPGTDVLWPTYMGGPERRSHIAAGRRATFVVENTRLAQVGACVSTSRVTRSKAARARDGSGRRT